MFSLSLSLSPLLVVGGGVFRLYLLSFSSSSLSVLAASTSSPPQGHENLCHEFDAGGGGSDRSLSWRARPEVKLALTRTFDAQKEREREKAFIPFLRARSLSAFPRLCNHDGKRRRRRRRILKRD